MKRLIVFVSVISQLNVQHFRYDSCCRRTRFSFETHPFHKTFCTRLRNELCLFDHKHSNQSWKKSGKKIENYSLLCRCKCNAIFSKYLSQYMQHREWTTVNKSNWTESFDLRRYFFLSLFYSICLHNLQILIFTNDNVI